MSSLLGPSLAFLFLYFYVQEWIQNHPIDFEPITQKGYVDDLFW